MVSGFGVASLVASAFALARMKLKNRFLEHPTPGNL